MTLCDVLLLYFLFLFLSFFMYFSFLQDNAFSALWWAFLLLEVSVHCCDAVLGENTGSSL